MMELKEIVRYAYIVFSNYTVNRQLDVCRENCCLSAEAEFQLVNLPLKNIDCGLIQSWNDAAKTNSPDLIEFKHFLPRILELISKYEFPTHSAELSLKSFQYYSRIDWSEEEWQVLEWFMDAFFTRSLKTFPLPQYVAIEDLLVMMDKAGFDVSSYLTQWENAEWNEAIFHFSALVEYGVQFGSEKAFTNEFASKMFISNFSSWLNSNELQLGFKKKMETLILSDLSFDEVTCDSLDCSYEILSLATLKY